MTRCAFEGTVEATYVIWLTLRFFGGLLGLTPCSSTYAHQSLLFVSSVAYVTVRSSHPGALLQSTAYTVVFLHVCRKDL